MEKIKYFKGIIEFMISALAAFLFDMLKDQLQPIMKNDLITITISSLITIMFIIAFIALLNQFIIPFLSRSYFVRKCVFSLADFEGAWICTVSNRNRKFISRGNQNENSISIFHIRYNYDLERYEYYGTAYDCKGVVLGDWYSDSITFMNQGGFRFYATGHIIENNKLHTTESSGYIILNKQSDENFFSNGYTIDWRTNNGCSKTKGNKLTEKFLKEMIGESELKSDDDIRKLISKYVKWK